MKKLNERRKKFKVNDKEIDEKVNEWLKAGSSVDGYKGFAIGRSIFWNSLKGWHSGDKSREEAVSEIADSYLSFISVYQNGS